jgi:hypothetical protein
MAFSFAVETVEECREAADNFNRESREIGREWQVSCMTGASPTMFVVAENYYASAKQCEKNLRNFEQQDSFLSGSCSATVPGYTAASSRTATTGPDNRDASATAGSRHGSHRIQNCIGAVVNGVCHGTASPADQIRNQTGQNPRCYGTVLNGKCIGPEF